MKTLRKLLAITLLALLGLPFASSLLALTPRDKGNLPACCRRNGKHHCLMSVSDRQKLTADTPAFAPPIEKCLYAPAGLPGNLHPTALGALPAQIFFADLVSHPTAAAQTQSKRRISRERSRQKRGPPNPFL